MQMSFLSSMNRESRHLSDAQVHFFLDLFNEENIIASNVEMNINLLAMII